MMKNNYNSKNNWDRSFINNNDDNINNNNNNNNIKPLILVNNVFSHHAWTYLS